MNEIVEYQQNQMPIDSSALKLPAVNPQEIADRRQAVNQIMRSQMRDGVHYGTLPGMPRDSKPMLLKQGAEMLANTFQLGVNPKVELVGPMEEVGYRVTCELIHLPSGKIVGRGVGECSSLEEKYAWREAICREEWDYFPANMRRIKWKQQWNSGRPAKGQGYQVLQVRAEPQDKANTVLKMAKKRAFVDAIQTCLGCSDMFSQEGAEDNTPPAAQSRPSQRRNSPPPQDDYSDPPVNGSLSPGMINTVNRAIQAAGPDVIPDMLKQFGVNSVNELKANQINDVLDWLKGQGGDQ